MKRQRVNDHQEAKQSITFEDVLYFLQNDQNLTCDQLRMISRESDRSLMLQTMKTDLIVQNFSIDLLVEIFSRVPPTVARSPWDVLRMKKDPRFWFECRTVSKSWCSAISKMDFSIFLTNPPAAHLSLPRMLRLFKFSRIFLREKIDFSLLTNLRELDFCMAPISHELPKLTQLKSLTTSDAISNDILLKMTSIECLNLCSTHRPIKTISSLTNLTLLQVENPRFLQQSDLLVPNLKTVESNDPTFFKQGKGIWRYTTPKTSTPNPNYYGQLRYYGDWLDGKRHGQGTCYYYPNPDRTWIVGGVYDGDWVDDKREGRGVIRYFEYGTTRFDGSYYDGEMKYDTFCGKGTRVYANKESYQGDWKRQGSWKLGIKRGHGVYKFENGTVYDGQWDDDCMEGEGRCVYWNGDVYQGNWRGGKRHGDGVYQFASGKKIEGKWQENKLDPEYANLELCGVLKPMEEGSDSWVGYGGDKWASHSDLRHERLR